MPRSDRASCLFGFAMVFVLAASSFAAEEGMPKGLPPVVGTASVGERPNGNQWTIRLVLPRVAWEVVGEIKPKEQWPEVAAEVRKETRILKMGGPSALTPSRVVDLKGKELAAEDVAKLLAKETPVLVSLSGTMVDPYYLAVVKPDTLLIILGPRDGMPAAELLPAQKQARGK